MKINLQKFDPNAIVPTLGTPGSAGYDLYSLEDAILFKDKPTPIRTGIGLEIPKGYVGLICPRSGLSAKNAVTVHNGPGIIDSDYRSEIKVILISDNTQHNHIVKKGDRIGQIVFVKYKNFDFNIVGLLNSTERGENGFGSTGK